MTCNKKEITKHDRFSIFRSSLEVLMSGILKDDNYLWEWRIKGRVTIIHVTVT